jgi:hypothetical protein
MRSVDEATLQAFNHPHGIHPARTLTLYRNRTFFTHVDLDDGHTPAFAQGGDISEEPLAQDMAYCAQVDRVFTVYSVDGYLHFSCEGRESVTLKPYGYTGDPDIGGSSGYPSDPRCKPGMVDSPAGTFIFYRSPSANMIVCLVVDRERAAAGYADCILSESPFYVVDGPTSVISISEVDLVLLAIVEGGVGITYLSYTGAWQAYTCERRFMYPDKVYDRALDTDVCSLNYAAAVIHSGKLFVYFSYPDGTVYGVSRAADGSWSDIHEVVPGDLSLFKISNARVAPNNSIHLVGQFKRYDPTGAFSSSTVYCLDLVSLDGRVFSLDRFTLLALGDTESDAPEDSMGLRFFTGYIPTANPGQVIYADANRVLRGNAPVSVLGDEAENLLIPNERIIDLRGSQMDGWDVILANGDEYFDNLDLLVFGGKAKLHLGALKADGEIGYVEYDNCIISQINHDDGDAVRTLAIHITPLTLWKTSVMTHPFYLEIQSKQSHHTMGKEVLDNLYKASGDGEIRVPFMCHFWEGNADDPGPNSHSAQTSIWSGELTSSMNLKDLPEIEVLPLTVRLYGWSRTGGCSTNNEESGPCSGTGDGNDHSNDGGSNDAFSCILRVIDSAGQEQTFQTATLTNSSANHPPCTWYAAEEGSYPVEYTTDGLAGMKVKEVGFVVTPRSGETTYQIERLEIPELWMVFNGLSEFWDDIEISYGTVEVPPIFDKWPDTIEYHGEAFSEDFTAWGSSTTRDVGSMNGSWHPSAIIQPSFMEVTLEPASDPNNIKWQSISLYRDYYPLFVQYDPRAGSFSKITVPPPSTSYEAGHHLGAAMFTWANDNYADIGLGNGQDCHGGEPGYFGRRCHHLYIQVHDETDTYQYYQHPQPQSNSKLVRFSQVSVPGMFIAQETNCNLTYLASCFVRQDYDPASNHYTDGLWHVWIQGGKALGGSNYTFGQRLGLKIEYPDELANGYLAVRMKLVNAAGQSSTGVCFDDRIVNNYYPKLPKDDGKVALQTFAEGDEKWVVSSQAKPFGNPGYIGLCWLMEDMTTDVVQEWKIISIEWRDINNKTTELWNNEDCVEAGPTRKDAKTLLQVGAPVVYLDGRLYSTFNFEVAGLFKLTGEHAWAGCVGLATDGKNYVAARCSLEKLQIVKVRNNVHTVLAEKAIDMGDAEIFWLLFEHRDGNFTVRLRRASVDPRLWTTPDDVEYLTYIWQEEDGQMALGHDYLHVGFYAYKDNPSFRITSLDTTQSKNVGILPLSQSWVYGGGLPPENAGVIRVNGVKYNYTAYRPTEDIFGPYQCRNTGLGWSYSEDGETYGGNSVEFTKFEWIPNTGNRSKFNNLLMATDAGIAWLISDTDFKPWITTAKKKVYLRNRGRFFGGEVHGDLLGTSQKVWITEGFTGLSPAQGQVAQDHPEGEFAYIDYGDDVVLAEYVASSGHEDTTVEDMIDRICKLAGGTALFPGDTLVASKTLSGTRWVVSV